MGMAHGWLLIATAPVVTELPPVEVVAAPVLQEERILDNGAEVSELTRSQLSAINAQDLQSALRQVPGVTISRYSAVGSYGGGQGGAVFVRGLGVSRPGGELRVYSDGAPRESGVWSHPLMDANPVDFAEKVRVIKTPHPGLLAGTFAAVETETRRRATPGFEGETNLEYGRYNTLIGSVAAGGREGALDAYAGGAYKRSDGHRAHSAAWMDNAFFRIGWEFSDWARIAFIYTRTDSEVEDPGPKGSTSPKYDRFDLSSDLYNVRFDLQREEIEGYSLVYFEHGDVAWHKDHLVDGVASSPAGDADTTWLDIGTRHRYVVHYSDCWRSTFAGELARDGGHTDSTRYSDNRRISGYKGEFFSMSGYGDLARDFGLGEKWTLTPTVGARYYYHNRYDGEFAPAGSLVLDYDKKMSLFVQSSRAVHYPGVYTRALAADFAKNSLEAETLDSISAGVQAKFAEERQIKCSFFRNSIGERITRTVNRYINEGDVDMHGVEVSSVWRVTGDWKLYGGATFTRAENCRASRVPEWAFTAASVWRICDWLRWTLDGQYIGSMYAYSVRNAIADTEAAEKLDDGFLFNTRLSLPLESFCRQQGEIYLSVENFTNRHYEYYPGYPIGGAMWFVGCRLVF